jgi:hypothetical protein
MYQLSICGRLEGMSRSCVQRAPRAVHFHLMQWSLQWCDFLGHAALHPLMPPHPLDEVGNWQSSAPAATRTERSMLLTRTERAMQLAQLLQLSSRSARMLCAYVGLLWKPSAVAIWCSSVLQTDCGCSSGWPWLRGSKGCMFRVSRAPCTSPACTSTVNESRHARAAEGCVTCAACM